MLLKVLVSPSTSLISNEEPIVAVAVRIESIKEYRDEYMVLGCVKIRGERGSRRRAY